MSNKIKKSKAVGANSATQNREKKYSAWMTLVCALLTVAILAVALWCFTTDQQTYEMGSGACEYLESRDITGRDIKYAEVCIEGYGRFVLLLDATAAPKTVENFVSLVESKFYDGLTLHLVYENRLIQGGDPNADGTGGSTNTVKGEFERNGYLNPISHKRGVISMARSSDYDSATSQFFICSADLSGIIAEDELPAYDGNYAAFGYIVDGLSVIDEITADFAQYGDERGVISDKSNQPVIKYIKMLKSWEK